MADINKQDIKLLASQRLDDTTQGGGQMISTEILSGSINNLFPDISRLDRVYGRVSLRKAFLGVQTLNRPTYYGSHAALTINAKDPNVSVCFFSSKDWFDTRDTARQRIEAYLVKGPFYPAALWGNHFRGSRQLQMHTHKDWAEPVIGDVLVVVQYEGLSNEKYQYVRVTKVVSRIDTFTFSASTVYQKKILTINIGNMLSEDYTGEEIFWEGAGIYYGNSSQDTKIYTTVAADASQYYGVAALSEDADQGSLHIRVDSINIPLVPSAQSQTAITDAGVGQAITPMLQTNQSITSVTRSISFTIAANSKLFIGEGVLPGSFNWVGGLTLTDNEKGDILSGGTVVVGSINYATGICVFTNVVGTTSGTGIVTYIPACSPTEVASTGAIEVTIGNRGFSYVFSCDPLPKRGTVKIDYLAGGKWYSMQDKGNGSISGYDQSIGSGSVNAITGSVSMTLGAMPDVGSLILLFWAKDAPYYDLSGEVLPLIYEFTTTNTGIARNSFSCAWNSDAAAVKDDGDGNLTVATGTAPNWVKSATIVGTIHYASGKVKFSPHSSQVVPLTSEDMHVVYQYGDKHTTTFNPSRDGNGGVTMTLPLLPVVPGTLTIEWHTDQEEYDLLVELRRRSVDPTWTFQDNALGGLKNETGGGNPGYFSTTINYTAGVINLMPDRRGTFPKPVYDWAQSGPTDWRGVSRWIWSFRELVYISAASIWPTDGIISVEWCSSSGSTTDDYYIALPKKYFIKENSHIEIVPGSLDITAVVGATTYYLMDIGTGKLFRDVVGTTGIGTESGTINYTTRIVTITDNAILNREITVESCAGTAALEPTQMMVFRAPAAPIVPAVGGIKATLGNGTVIQGTFQSDGTITGTSMTGSIDYTTGVCMVAFGAWITDIWAALPPYDPEEPEEDPPTHKPQWYTDDTPINGANVWKPYSVRASTVMLNCVVTSYLPLDAELLGLDPVRLPMDGKVPIFRDGYIILVHHTLKENLPNPIVSGTTYTLSRGNVNLIELYDSTGRYFPEIDSVINYTVDLTAGSVTIAPTVSVVGYTQPFYAIHTIEDMCLASDVQITGHIATTNPLTHNYPKDDTNVSSILPSADLQARAYNEFVQSSWTGVWSNDLIGTLPLANYDFVNFPITVYNKGATKERWLLRFKSATAFEVIGEHLGVLLTDILINGSFPMAGGVGESGWYNDPVDGLVLRIKNRLLAEDYFIMKRAGLGVGWASGNSIRFNTDAANYPYWVVRTTLQAPPTEPFDSFTFQIRGDSA